MNERQNDRFDHSSLIRNNIDADDVYIELEFLDNLKGKIADISLKGVGFEIEEISREQMDILSGNEEYYLKIYVEKEFFLVGVKNRWHSTNMNGGKPSFRGGVEIDIISPEDSVRLVNLIQRMRED